MLDKTRKPLPQLGTKNIFWRRNFGEFFPFEKPHSSEKCGREILWDLLTYILMQNIKKTRRGTLLRHKNFSKKLHSAEKIERGGPLVSSGFVGSVKKLKMKGVPFALSLHWLDLA